MKLFNNYVRAGALSTAVGLVGLGGAYLYEEISMPKNSHFSYNRDFVSGSFYTELVQTDNDGNKISSRVLTLDEERNRLLCYDVPFTAFVLGIALVGFGSLKDE